MTADPIKRAVHAVRLTQLLAEVDPAELHTETVLRLSVECRRMATRCKAEIKRRKTDHATEETT